MVVGVGGGGPLDAAKAVAMLAVNPGTAEEYQMGRAVEVDPLPFIAVPTTVGTGSEATMVAVLRNRRAGVVKAIREPRMIPPVAVLDPLLLAGLPPRLLRLGACDALAHGIESYLSLGATGFTRAHSFEGVRLVSKGLRSLAAGEPDAAAAPALLLGSYFAGVALQAGPGLAHVLAQPITAVTGIPHSAAIAALLPRPRVQRGPPARRRRLRLLAAPPRAAGRGQPGRSPPPPARLGGGRGQPAGPRGQPGPGPRDPGRGAALQPGTSAATRCASTWASWPRSSPEPSRSQAG